jgi:hypothetical protein
VLHAVPPLLQAKLFGQVEPVPGVHVPVPLHVPVGVSVSPVHEAVPQLTVFAACWQVAPAAQLPVFPHGGLAVHWLAGTGAVPVVTSPHVPFVPPVSAAEHAWHVPVHATLQQKPFAQKPVSHVVPVEHAVPLAAPPSLVLVSVATSPPLSVASTPPSRLDSAEVSPVVSGVVSVVVSSVASSPASSLVTTSIVASVVVPPSSGIKLRLKSTISSQPGSVATTRPATAAPVTAHLIQPCVLIAVLVVRAIDDA